MKFNVKSRCAFVRHTRLGNHKLMGLRGRNGWMALHLGPVERHHDLPSLVRRPYRGTCC